MSAKTIDHCSGCSVMPLGPPAAREDDVEAARAVHERRVSDLNRISQRPACCPWSEFKLPRVPLPAAAADRLGAAVVIAAVVSTSVVPVSAGLRLIDAQLYTTWRHLRCSLRWFAWPSQAAVAVHIISAFTASAREASGRFSRACVAMSSMRFFCNASKRTVWRANKSEKCHKPTLRIPTLNVSRRTVANFLPAARNARLKRGFSAWPVSRGRVAAAPTCAPGIARCGGVIACPRQPPDAR